MAGRESVAGRYIIDRRMAIDQFVVLADLLNSRPVEL